MSGHSHWSGIKNKKAATDVKRGRVFSKLLNAISIAAKSEPNPQFNPRLRTTIDKAKENKVPQENIDRAIRRATEEKDLEKLIIEAYGPEGTAIIIETVTNNKNRTISEIKNILSDNNAKFAGEGNVRWAFDPPTPKNDVWQAKFKQQISDDAQKKLRVLVEKLEEYEDIEGVITNT